MPAPRLWPASQGATSFKCMTDEHVTNAYHWLRRNIDWEMKCHRNISYAARLRHEFLDRQIARRQAAGEEVPQEEVPNLPF